MERNHLKRLHVDGKTISNEFLKITLESLDWIDLAEDWNKWQVYARQVINLRLPQNVGNFLNI